MKKIDTLISQAIVTPFFITLTVLTFVIFISKISSWSKLFITNNASLEAMSLVTLSIFPTILIFSLPISYLIGILIGVGGINGENQITALRACGVSIRRLLRVVWIFGICVGIITSLFSVVLLPKTNEILKKMKEEILLSQASTEIQPRVFNDDLPQRVFYVDDVSPDRKEWSRIFLVDNSSKKTNQIVLARKGTWIVVNEAGYRRLQLHLERGSRYSIDVEKPGNAQITEFMDTDIPIDLNEPGEPTVPIEGQPKKAGELGMFQLWQRGKGADSDGKIEAEVEFNQRLALPFSVFPFALLGFSLAVRYKKGGRTSGFALSLIVVLFFYILFINGIRLASIGKLSPWLGPWTADIVLGIIGIFIFLKTERSSGSETWFSAERWRQRWDKLGTRYHMQRIQSGISRFDNRLFQTVSALIRFLFPKVFDLYIARGFLIYFLWSLATCSVLFMLITLFELLDDCIRNSTPILQLVEYFTFLVPQILMMAVPMSVLLAILINFGILEKNSEITAIKAGGWSLYRISIPIFLLSSALCLGLFLIQDYVLPTANERQDGIWRTIKGRPPQTASVKRKWILGESGRIYNYEHFDEKQDAFVGLNIYETDLETASIDRIVRADRARINPQGVWILESGWIRDYRLDQNGFRTITTERFSFPEKADYFKKEIFQPTESSKMTYQELLSYINYLVKSGYNAIGLKVELHKKIAFPLSCLTMALLAIPFSFIIGRRGALFGIGASIAIAILYLMVSGLFESMGIYGILTPLLAAWAPNVLFGAAGFWLFLSVRT
jgi:LPS export ABC transporter permease LptG/LPS export ABC transporter permease LptF